MVLINPFISVLRGNEPDRIPVWFMRQAGRYLPEYQRIRKGMSIQDICRNTDAVEEITKLPVNILGVDASIIFSDIMIPMESMGFDISFKEGFGPLISNSLLEVPDMRGISEFDPTKIGYPIEKSIKTFKNSNPDLPLIGFTGGPITLLSYAVKGASDRNLQTTKAFMQMRQGTYSDAMRQISDMVADYAKLQYQAGADAIQIFDSWAGSLSPYSFQEYVNVYLSPVINEIKSVGVPLIYFGTELSGHLEQLAPLDFDVLSTDWKTRLSSVRQRTGDKFILQGNLDPSIAASPAHIKETMAIVEDIGDDPRFIFNLGHGVLPETPPENLRSISNYVHAFR